MQVLPNTEVFPTSLMMPCNRTACRIFIFVLYFGIVAYCINY